MISVVKYSGLILISIVLGVICNPVCYNWCPSSNGYSASCCDYYPGQAYYPGYPNGGPYQQGSVYPGYPGYQQFSPQLFCPQMNCTKTIDSTTTILKNCTSDDDCLRKEKCCTNPCDEGNKACFIGSNRPVQSFECPVVDNCSTWLEENKNVTTCNDINDCKRTEVCCLTPCIDIFVCQKSTFQTQTRNPGQCPYGPQGSGCSG